jgi:hypothetical protein
MVRLVEALLELLERQTSRLVVLAELAGYARPVGVRDEEIRRCGHARNARSGPAAG